MGDPQMYLSEGKKEPTTEGIIVIRSLVWPGAYILYQNGYQFNVYFGFGHKTEERVYYPVYPPMVLVEPVDVSECPEPQPVLPADVAERAERAERSPAKPPQELVNTPAKMTPTRAFPNSIRVRLLAVRKSHEAQSPGPAEFHYAIVQPVKGSPAAVHPQQPAEIQSKSSANVPPSSNLMPNTKPVAKREPSGFAGPVQPSAKVDHRPTPTPTPTPPPQPPPQPRPPQPQPQPRPEQKKVVRPTAATTSAGGSGSGSESGQREPVTYSIPWPEEKERPGSPEEPLPQMLSPYNAFEMVEGSPGSSKQEREITAKPNALPFQARSLDAPKMTPSPQSSPVPKVKKPTTVVRDFEPLVLSSEQLPTQVLVLVLKETPTLLTLATKPTRMILCLIHS